jgi:hypothetical protein
MREAYLNECTGGAIRAEGGHRPRLQVGDWLGFAAAPTFAIMAALTGILSGGQPDILCSAMAHMSPLGGMAPMYLLMSAFHLPPWLKLIFGRSVRGA